MGQMDASRAAYLEEARELLAELETAILELETEPQDRDLVDRVFRGLHTIKGSGSMFGFDEVAAFTHDVENVFDRVRGGEIEVSKDLLSLTLRARDHIQRLLGLDPSGEEPDHTQAEEILAGMRAFLPSGDEVQATSQGSVLEKPVEETRLFRIRFKPQREIFLTGSSPFSLLKELVELGEAKMVAHMEGLPNIESIDPQLCYTWWDILLHARADLNLVKDVFIFVEDECQNEYQVIDTGDHDVAYKRLGEILLERGDIDEGDLEKVLANRPLLGELLESSGLVSHESIESALMEQATVRELRSANRTKESEGASSIRVAADKLDCLVDLVGELVTVQAQISQVVAQRQDPMLTSLSEELERLSNELRDQTLGIRMLPIGTTFSRFKRLVRDLSAELGKEIELVTKGAETELDKTVIEKLGDPLVHILRNSIDHGVETPEERERLGKPRKGTIVLNAEHRGGEVLISVTDDGRGINPASIRAKAVEKGLINPDVELTEKEILGLIFAPGFSTAAAVTNVSGRGVGMDVVRRSIDSLRGIIDVSSKPGHSTGITIKLPLTLAIIDGLQVEVGQESFVLPLSVVEECVELKRKECTGGGQVISLRGEIVPYIRLREWFEIGGESPDIEQLVVASLSDGRIGIVVDRVVGEHQTVIKSLGRLYREVQGISGATIKGDGTMALIVDIPDLVRSVQSH